MDVAIPGVQAFAPNVWIIDGPTVRDFGVLFTTRMTVVKLTDGSVWIESPVSVPFETLKRISEWGQVRYLVAATPRHVWRLAAWHTLFPDAQLWVPRPTPFTLQKGHLPLTGLLKDTPPSDWSRDFDQLAFQGNPLIEEVLFFHKTSRTVILGDLIQVHPKVQGKPLRNALFQLEGVASPLGGVGLDFRLSFTNRKLAQRSLDKLLSWDFDKLIIAHGACIEKDAKSFIERAFHWLRH
ncbi:MAG TPA: DUF4336 domain-containing protein [Ktedonobacteraceae bacterium]|jgi:hypothetical protein|nr:DUF4336 domain-containing protein [Ktedonobacteraceae bacterium]